MHITEAGLDFIRRWEGCSLLPYRCPAGIPTIGYGHVVRDENKYRQGISRQQAEALLVADVALVEGAMRRLISVPLLTCQWDALVSFTFNLGAGRLQMSTLRLVVNRAEHAAVPEQLMRWIYCSGKPLAGLIKRRKAESEVYQGKFA